MRFHRGQGLAPLCSGGSHAGVGVGFCYSHPIQEPFLAVTLEVGIAIVIYWIKDRNAANILKCTGQLSQHRISQPKCQ